MFWRYGRRSGGPSRCLAAGSRSVLGFLGYFWGVLESCFGVLGHTGWFLGCLGGVGWDLGSPARSSWLFWGGLCRPWPRIGTIWGHFWGGSGEFGVIFWGVPRSSGAFWGGLWGSFLGCPQGWWTSSSPTWRSPTSRASSRSTPTTSCATAATS